MEELEKQVKGVYVQFFRECVGNRLNQFNWGALTEITLKMIRDYKVKNENKTK